MINIELFKSYGARHIESGLTVDLNKSRRPKDPLGPLCRLLRENGYDNEERVHVTRNGVPVFARDRKLSKWAGEDVADTEKRPAHARKYREFVIPSGGRISEKVSG